MWLLVSSKFIYMMLLKNVCSDQKPIFIALMRHVKLSSVLKVLFIDSCFMGNNQSVGALLASFMMIVIKIKSGGQFVGPAINPTYLKI